MRKLFTALTVSAILATLAVGSASAKPNAHPLFVGSGMSISYDNATGRAYLHYTVAGLGNGGYGYVKGHGKFTYTAQCQKRNGTNFQVRVDRLGVVNEHDIFGDANGNYPGDDPLHPSSICPNGATLIGVLTWQWTQVSIDLMSGPGGRTYDTWTYVN